MSTEKEVAPSYPQDETEKESHGQVRKTQPISLDGTANYTDILGQQSIDPVLDAKMHIVNDVRKLP